MKQREQDLNKKIIQIWWILIDAKRCLEYSFYLHKPETPEEADYLSRSKFFYFSRQVLWKMAIIELSKLFCNSKKDRDHFNLYRFISNLKKGEYLGGLGIDDNTIKKWEMDLSSHQALIDRVVGLRDQVYAHTDSNAKDLDKVDITFEDVKKLIEFAEEIIQEIHSAILGVEARLFPPVFEAETFDIIKILAEQERREFE